MSFRTTAILLTCVLCVPFAHAQNPKVPDSVTFEPDIEYSNPEGNICNSTWPGRRPATGRFPQSSAFTAADSEPGRGRVMTD